MQKKIVLLLMLLSICLQYHYVQAVHNGESAGKEPSVRIVASKKGMIKLKVIEGDPISEKIFRGSELLIQAADQMIPSALYILGVLHLYGNGVVKDEAEAARLFQLAAEQGDPSVQCRVGLRYYNGDGLPQNVEEAARLFRLAAGQGDTKAQSMLEGMPLIP